MFRRRLARPRSKHKKDSSSHTKNKPSGQYVPIFIFSGQTGTPGNQKLHEIENNN